MPESSILLTGASRGIGYKTAIELAQRGYRVVGVARSEEKLKNLQTLYPKHFQPVSVDLSKIDETKLLTDALSDFAPFQAVIHNAGGIINKKFDHLTDADWHYLIELNIMAAVRLYRKLPPYMQIPGHILTISSMGGYMGATKYPGLAAYSTTKGALTTLSECLAAEWQDQKISSNCLCLGAVQTEMFEDAFPGMSAPVTSENMAEFIADFALKGHRYFNGKVLPVSLEDPK